LHWAANGSVRFSLFGQLCTLAFRLSGDKHGKRDGFIAKGLTLLQEFWIALFSLFFERETREKMTAKQ